MRNIYKRYNKQAYIKIALIVLAIYILAIGILYGATKIFGTQINSILPTSPSRENETGSPSGPQKTSGTTQLSFAKIDGEFYIKMEIRVPENTQSQIPNLRYEKVRVYSYDEDYEPVLRNIAYTQYNWTDLTSKSFDINLQQEWLIVNDRLFSFKRIPNSESLLFITDWTRGTSDFVSTREVYFYKKEKETSNVAKVLELDRSKGASFPKIGSFSANSRYVDLDLFGCWNCDGGFPEKLLIDLEALKTKNIGRVSQFHWQNNGTYEYKDLVMIDCEEEGPWYCTQDPKTLPLKTGNINQ